MSARRGGRLPASVFVDRGRDRPVRRRRRRSSRWLALWPALGAALGAGPILLVTHNGVGATVVPIAIVAAATVAIARSVAREPDEG